MNTFLMPIEDMKAGVIYRDRRGVGVVLCPCVICGKPRAVTLLHGKPLTYRCNGCQNKTPEKRAILSKAHKGIPISSQTLQKRLEAYSSPDNYHNDPDYRARIAEAIRIRGTSLETRRKISIANKGKLPSSQCRVALKQRMKELFADKKWAEKQLAILYQARLQSSPEIEALRRKKISKSSKERWGNSDYREETIKAMFKGRAIRPTKPEMQLDKLLQEHFPHQWIYNGDFSRNVIIGGLVPDFVNINGKKQVIELFGEYYHKPNSSFEITLTRTEKGRIAKLKEFGFNCLIIWESEMKHPEKVLAKIEAFNG